MDIQNEKIGLIEWIIRIDDVAVLQKLIRIKEESRKLNEWPDDISKEEIDSINRGLKNIEEGKLHSHKSVKKIYEKFK